MCGLQGVMWGAPHSWIVLVDGVGKFLYYVESEVLQRLCWLRYRASHCVLVQVHAQSEIRSLFWFHVVQVVLGLGQVLGQWLGLGQGLVLGQVLRYGGVWLQLGLGLRLGQWLVLGQVLGLGGLRLQIGLGLGLRLGLDWCFINQS